MVTFESKVCGQTVNLPETFDEIKTNDIAELVSHIKLGNGKVLVALCEKASLFEFAVSLKSSKHTKVGVTTLIAKVNDADRTKYNIEAGDLAVVTDNAVEQGVHCYIPSKASYTNIFKIMSMDEELRKSIMDKNNPLSTKYVYVFEFKILSAFDICASYNRDYVLKDAYGEALE